jgi:hypothetical protein
VLNHSVSIGAISEQLTCFFCCAVCHHCGTGIYSAYIDLSCVYNGHAGALMSFDPTASLPEQQMLMQQQLQQQQQMHMQLKQQQQQHMQPTAQQMMIAPPQQQQQAAPTTMGAYKSPHAQRKCEYQGCTKAPSYAFRGKSAAFCGAHREPNMVSKLAPTATFKTAQYLSCECKHCLSCSTNVCMTVCMTVCVFVCYVVVVGECTQSEVQI